LPKLSNLFLAKSKNTKSLTSPKNSKTSMERVSKLLLSIRTPMKKWKFSVAMIKSPSTLKST
jgi:hypothetical protein